MMRSGFFNSEIIGTDDDGMPIFDRAEEASFFAFYFSSFIGNGVYPNPSSCMQILAKDKMTLTVKTGSCYIRGYLGWLEEDDEIQLDVAPTLLNRIDRIVARLDLTTRLITLETLKGIEATTPVPPSITRNADIYELGLADVYIKKNVGVLPQTVITDLRFNKSVCGIVTGAIDQIDTTELFAQYQAVFNKDKAEFDEWFLKSKNRVNDFISDSQSIINKLTSKADAQQQRVDENTAKVNAITADLEHKRDTGAFTGPKGDNGVCVPTNGFYSFYINEIEHLICVYPDESNPPDVMIDRDVNSPTYRHLLLNTGGAENA